VGEGVLEARQELMATLSDERISWVIPERYHITLRFIGDTRVKDIPGIGHSLMEQVNVPRKTTISLSTAESFGPRKKPRVIWVGFEQNTLFESLRENVDRGLEVVGIPREGKSFRAHLTLGRIRGLKDLASYYDVMDRMRDRFREQVVFERLVFYRSELGSGGPVYTPLYQLDFAD